MRSNPSGRYKQCLVLLLSLVTTFVASQDVLGTAMRKIQAPFSDTIPKLVGWGPSRKRYTEIGA